MTLSKLKIEVFELAKPEEIEVLFNPNSITITKSGWRSDQTEGLVARESVDSSLSVELFFDTSLPNPSPENDLQQIANMGIGRSSLRPQLTSIKDVTTQTNPICRLTQGRSDLKNTDGDRPPICKLYWGKNTPFFQGILKSVTQTLTRFSEDGTPLRATLNCDFQAWKNPETAQKELNPIDDPIRIVKRGETLSRIAAEEYGDPNLWRLIAVENKLLNPRLIRPGDRLTVPPLGSESIGQWR